MDDLSKQIEKYDIDIEGLKDFIQQVENESFELNEDGEIINKSLNESFIAKILSYIKKIFYYIYDHIKYKQKKEEEEEKEKEKEEEEEKNICGIINIGNHCYLNAGLQILSRCYHLIKELILEDNYEKDKLIKLFVESTTILIFKKDKFYNPTKFIECFCKINKDFNVGKQNCSQDFIRTMLRNINDILDKNKEYKDYKPKDQNELDKYNSFVLENKVFPESKAYSIFSGMIKVEIKSQCNECNAQICDYSFSNFVDQILYLDSFSTRCKFTDVLNKNIGQPNKASMKCPKCKETINCESISKYIKIPEIFIFTLERYLVRNKVPIEPDEYINIHSLVDSSLDIYKYKTWK